MDPYYPQSHVHSSTLFMGYVELYNFNHLFLFLLLANTYHRICGATSSIICSQLHTFHWICSITCYCSYSQLTLIIEYVELYLQSCIQGYNNMFIALTLLWICGAIYLHKNMFIAFTLHGICSAISQKQYVHRFHLSGDMWSYIHNPIFIAFRFHGKRGVSSNLLLDIGSFTYNDMFVDPTLQGICGAISKITC